MILTLFNQLIYKPLPDNIPSYISNIEDDQPIQYKVNRK